MANEKRDGEGRFASKGVTGQVRDNPWTSAAIAAGAAGVGVFLWSRRNQIGEQLTSLNEQIGSWSESMRGSGELETANAGGMSGSELDSESGSGASAFATSKPSGGSNRATGGRSGKASGATASSPSRDMPIEGV